MQIDLLIERILEKRNPTVIGLDTRLEYLPQGYIDALALGEIDSFSKAAQAIELYNYALIDALCDIVPAVKVQVAYYEMYGVAGMRAFRNTIKRAKKRGLSVIADVKRNDIGATASAYSAAYLGKTALPGAEKRAFHADFATVNGYLGSDGVKPFITDCEKYGGGIFVLVKTSNPSSGELQDQLIGERHLYEVVGDMVAEWGESTIGQYGYSSVGAVVGATYPEQCAALRKRLPHTFFLVPGYGAQGATGADLQGCFDENGLGAIVNASRSILCAWKKRDTTDFASAARDEAIRMRGDITPEGMKR